MAEKNTGPLATRLAAAQAEMENASLDKVNPHFKSTYASLASIRDATVPALAKRGIAVVQGTRFEDDRLIAFTRLLTDDEWIESTYPVMVDKPQQMGSALTYARRYMLSAMCGVSADDDDDGNAAQQAGAPEGSTRQQGGPQPATEESIGEIRVLLTKAQLDASERAAFDKALAGGISQGSAEKTIAYLRSKLPSTNGDAAARQKVKERAPKNGKQPPVDPDLAAAAAAALEMEAVAGVDEQAREEILASIQQGVVDLPETLEGWDAYRAELSARIDAQQEIEA